ncbi:MAG: hypothetical protein MI757_09675 [Pirellulales bacterium]|nr:hypothetical protein [Pirellulales bacterium]
MATACENGRHNSTISDDAYGLLVEYSSDVSDVLYNVAELIALKRGSVDDNGCAAIESQDIQQAKVVVKKIIEKAVTDGVFASEDAMNALAPLLEDNK